MQNGSLTADAWGHRQTEFNMENGPAGLKKKKIIHLELKNKAGLVRVLCRSSYSQTYR